MSPDHQPQFPNPENQPPGRAAFEDACQALGNETVTYQTSNRRIEAIYSTDPFFVDVTCGDSDTPISRFGTGHDHYLTAKVGRFNSRSFSLGELAVPGGIQTFLGSEPPTERVFRPGQKPVGDMSDETFDLAMRHLQEDLPTTTLSWIHEALRTIQLPPEHSSDSARVDKIIELAKGVPGVPLELGALVDIDPIRAVNGWALKAFWRSANQTALERGGERDLTQTSISLNHASNDNQRYFYIRDVYGNETVAAEVTDSAEREVLNFIGYNTSGVGNWDMWSRDAPKRDTTPPPDSALQDFARRIQDTLGAPRLAEHDMYIHLEDGTLKIRRPDGTTY